MELDAVRCPFVGETAKNFACFCVPKLYGAIEASGKELGPIVVKGDILDSFTVAHVRSHALTVSEHIPNFARAVMRCAQ